LKRTSKKNKPRISPFWERAYRGHAYWLGKQKLGKVTLLVAHNLNPKGRYQWEAAGKAGFADELDKAKAAVEFAVLTAEKQRDLFQ
jgi:hypothetical protein